MQVLVLAAPKSGVGRTTLTYRLAREAMRQGAGPVVMLDADPKGELCRLCAKKGPSDLIIVPWDQSCSGPEFQRLKAHDGGLILVDAPLPEAPQAFAQTLPAADLVAILVRPREDDFSELGGLVDMVETTGKPYFFLVNRAKKHGNMAAATAIALAQYGPVCPVVLPDDERIAPSLRAKVFRKPKRSEAQVRREQLWAYLAERLAGLRPDAPSEAPAETADETEEGPDRRRFTRHGYDIGATFTWDGKVFPCRIQNVSAGGLGLTTDLPLSLGTAITVQIPYLGEFDALAVHREDGSVGLSFIIDEWQQAGLVRDLTGLLGAGRGGPAAPKAKDKGTAKSEASSESGPVATPKTTPETEVARTARRKRA